MIFRGTELRYAEGAWTGEGSLGRSGRYNLAKTGRVLYLTTDVNALNAENGLIEVDEHGQERSIPFGPRSFLSAHVSIENVLDLTSTAVQKLLGTDRAELVRPWAPFNERSESAPTQVLGLGALNSGRIHALLAPSARRVEVTNVVVFVDRLSGADRLEPVQ